MVVHKGAFWTEGTEGRFSLGFRIQNVNYNYLVNAKARTSMVVGAPPPCSAEDCSITPVRLPALSAGPESNFLKITLCCVRKGLILLLGTCVRV